MPATYFLLVLLVGGWILLVAAFIWMHVPERPISEIIRAVESRRSISTGRANLPAGSHAAGTSGSVASMTLRSERRR